MKQAQQSRVQPRGLALAKRVVEVEADLHVLEQREAFDIADRNSVLEEHPGVIGAQRQTMLGRYAEDVDLDTAAKIGPNHVGGIAEGEPVQLAIAHGRRFAREIENFLAVTASQLLDWQLGRLKLAGERHIRAADQ